MLAVWGPEMTQDAVEIHGIPHASIIEIGSSRVDISRSKRILNQGLRNTRYVLFAGSGIQHIDEINALLECRKAMNELGYQDVKLMYRPHPWMLRGKSDYIDQRIANTPGVVMDPDILKKGEGSFYNLESLSHLEELVKGCEFLIAGHSTVIVEALYYGKKVLAFNASSHPLFSNEDSWSIYRHMQRISDNPGVFQCFSLNRTKQTMHLLLEQKNPGVNYVPELIPNFAIDYNSRLISALNSIVG
jgi:hypothetical protein